MQKLVRISTVRTLISFTMFLVLSTDSTGAWAITGSVFPAIFRPAVPDTVGDRCIVVVGMVDEFRTPIRSPMHRVDYSIMTCDVVDVLAGDPRTTRLEVISRGAIMPSVWGPGWTSYKQSADMLMFYAKPGDKVVLHLCPHHAKGTEGLDPDWDVRWFIQEAFFLMGSPKDRSQRLWLQVEVETNDLPFDQKFRDGLALPSAYDVKKVRSRNTFQSWIENRGLDQK
jgi:hypothetical protein